MDRKQVDCLHQQASSAYLEGNYEDALAAWRKVLVAEPSNEEAAEGIRLCEQLSAGTSGESDLSSDEQVELSSLDGLEFDIDSSSADEPLSGLSQAAADLESFQDEMCDGDEMVEITSVSPEVDENATSEAAAEAELRHRVNELLASALKSMEQGNAEEAEQLLSRVLILDERNEVAMGLRLKIEEEGELRKSAAPLAVELEAEAEPSIQTLALNESSSAGTLDLDDDDLDGPAPALADLGDAQHDGELVETPPLVGADLAGEDTENEDAAEPAKEQDPVVLPTAPVARPTSRFDLRALLGGKKAMIGAAVLLLVALGAVAAVRFTGGGPAPVDAESARVDAQVASMKREVAAEPAGPNAAAAQNDTPPPENNPEVALPPEARTLEQTLAEADAAFEAEDYGIAVLAYGRVLEIDPSHAVASNRLTVAGNRYRQQRELEEQWEKGISSFEAGNYVPALQVFYRLPDSADKTRVNRYIRNGWYNLGVGSLRSGSCRTALDQFKEAQLVDATDRGVQGGLRLARGCATERSTTSFAVAVDALRVRGLED